MSPFRAATPLDLPRIVEFQLALARETEDLVLDAETVRRGVSAVFHDAALGRYFVADDAGAVVASLLITEEWSDWRNGSVWWIQSVYVMPAARGRGVYGGLYAYVRALADADDGVRGIRLYVDERNHPAQRVYARLGMNGEHYRVFEWMKG